MDSGQAVQMDWGDLKHIVKCSGLRVEGLVQTSGRAVKVRVSAFDPWAEVDDSSWGHSTKPLDIVPAKTTFGVFSKI